MNVINFNEKTCEKIRRYFDSYLDNELLVETNHEVLRHLSVCPDCTKVLDARARLKRTVKRAVDQETAPAALLESIQNRIRGRRSFFDFDYRRWAVAAAALVILAAGSMVAVRTGHIFAPVITAGEDSFQLISAEAQELMRVGLADHVHCALVLGKWKELLSFDHMREATDRSALGPEFIGLVPMVQQKLGPNFQMIQGHRCVTNHREYVHLILTGNNGAILSLVITEKNGEAFNHADIAATMQASGVPLYRANEGQLEIAGFETNRYLVYVVSNLDRGGNLKVASSLALPVYEYLHRLEG
jgi:anti-sigma factor (TIGR02949 family)